MTLQSIQNIRQGKLKMLVLNQEQDLVLNSGSSSFKKRLVRCQKAVSMPVCSWGKDEWCPWHDYRSVMTDSFFRDTHFLFSYVLLPTILLFIRTFIYDEYLMQRSDAVKFITDQNIRLIQEWAWGSCRSGWGARPAPCRRPVSLFHSAQWVF